MDSGSLRNRVDLYGKVETVNELGEKDYLYDTIKSVFVNIIPANLSGNVSEGQAKTQYAETTHKIKCRKLSIKDLSIDMYFKYDDLRYDILYFQPDFKNKEFWEIMVKVKYE